jgi:hypothetical protein
MSAHAPTPRAGFPPEAARRAWRLLARPHQTWAEIAALAERPRALLLGHVVPLSLLPACAWMLGLVLFPDDIGGAATPRDAAHLAALGCWTFAGSLATVGLLAAAIAAVAPMYGRPRQWAAAFRVAAYGLTPVWASGVLLLKPALVLLIVVAAMHACVLLHGGMVAVLGVRADDAAEYVAMVVFLAVAASTLLGGAMSFAGLW